MIVNVREHGAVGDGITDDWPAFADAMASIEVLDAVNFASGARLYVPYGRYRLSKPLILRRQMILEGDGGTGWFAGSTLAFDPGVDGIIVQRNPFNVTGDPKWAHDRGDWSTIRDLAVVSSPSAGGHYEDGDPLTAGPEHNGHPYVAGSGIVLFARALIDSVYVGYFQQDGIHVESIEDWKNANGFQIHNCRVDNIGRHGLFCAGENANAGMVYGLDVGNAGRWGIYDRSFLGNTYMGCQVAECAGGGYKTTGGVQVSTFFGCYSESDNPNDIMAPSVWIGMRSGGDYVLDQDGLRGVPLRGPVTEKTTRLVRPADYGSPNSFWHYNVVADERTILVDCSSGNVNLIMPVPVAGRRYSVQLAGPSDYSVYITVLTARPIDNSLAWMVLGGPRASVELVADVVANQYITAAQLGNVTRPA